MSVAWDCGALGASGNPQPRTPRNTLDDVWACLAARDVASSWATCRAWHAAGHHAGQKRLPHVQLAWADLGAVHAASLRSLTVQLARNGIALNDQVRRVLDVVAETEVGLPSNKITASLAHSGLLKGLKATLSGNPQDVKTAKLALQYLQGAVGLKADLTDLTAGAPKADVSLCWSEGDLAAGVSGAVDTKAFPDPAALPGKLSYAVQSTGVVPDSTVALALSDAFDTVKASIVTKARPDPASPRC